MEELEKDPSVYDKCHRLVGDRGIGQNTISNFLGGPWLREYQINLIAEALAQLRDIEEGHQGSMSNGVIGH